MARYTPEKFNIVTSSDDIGAIVDLPRITGESLASYKRRILESSERLSNSSYEGLINGINRELGLERLEVLEVDLKKKYQINLSHTDISFSSNVLNDNRYYSDTIDGTNIIATGNQLNITTGVVWGNNELVGLYLFVNGNKYQILKNEVNIVFLDGDISNNNGNTFEIKPDWRQDELVGLALHIGSRKYEIIQNDNNSIMVDSNISDNFGEDCYITSLRPRIHVTASRLILYKEYLNEDNFQLDIEIPLREGALYINNIADSINSSSFFECSNLQPSRNIPAKTIKQQDSDKRANELVPGSKFFRLTNKNIKHGTLKFSESSSFLREVSDIESAPIGPYFAVDYKEGIIRAKNVPNGTGTVSYVYSVFPFRLESAPAIITPFTDKESESFLFAQQEKVLYEDERDRYISSQPKSDMIEYISELLKVKDQTWGR